MRIYIKKILVLAVAATVAMSGVNVSSVKAASEFDGDITENPWGDIFDKDNQNPGDLPIDNNNDGQTNINTDKNQTAAQRAAAIAKLKKALKTKVVSAKKAKKTSKKAKVTLKKNKKAAGYQVQYSTSKKFKKSKTKTKTSKKNKLTIKKLKAGKKYYVRARVYGKAYETKVYGKWSKKKIIKVKKK